MKKNLSAIVVGIILSLGGHALGLTFTTLNNPSGVGFTGAFGISDGNVVGDYSATFTGTHHGFIYNIATNNWTNINYPHPWETWAYGISGNFVVGSYEDTTTQHGFLYDRSANSWTTLDAPNATQAFGYGTVANGIDGNNIVGFYDVQSSGLHGFIYNTISKTWTTIDNPSPGATDTSLGGISGSIVVGSYLDSSRTSHGFIYDMGTNSWTTTSYLPLGVQGNSIVGSYRNSPASVTHGFYSDGSSFLTLDDPNAGTLNGTHAVGIDGNIVSGYYSLPGSSNQYSGFIVTVPEPSSIILAGSALVAATALVARRKRRTAV